MIKDSLWRSKISLNIPAIELTLSTIELIIPNEINDY